MEPVKNQPATTGKAKVGILTYNDTVFSHAVDTFLVPALKRLGYTPIVGRSPRSTPPATTAVRLRR